MDVRNVVQLLRDPKGAAAAARLAVMLHGDAWQAGHHFAAHLSDAERLPFALGLLAGTDTAVSFERHGLRWTADADESNIARELALRGSYQGDDVEAMIRWARANRPGRDVVVDVGANIGTTTVPLARAGFRVVAIEAVPATVALLRANIEQNDLGDLVTVVACAVSDSPTVTMMLTGSSGTSEVAGTHPPGYLGQGFRTTGSVDVPAEGLGAILAGVGVHADEIAFVWSDTQGHEQVVVETGGDLWSAVPLYVEYWPGGLDAHGGTAAFLDAVSSRFSRFATRESLGDMRPIEDLPTVDPGRTTDLLLW